MKGCAPCTKGGATLSPLQNYPLNAFHIAMKPSHPSPPDWIEVTIEADPVTHEAISNFLMEMPGCGGVAAEQSGNRMLKAYLPDEGSSAEGIGLHIEAFLQKLRAFFPDAGPSSLQLDRIQDQDWRTAWRIHFGPEQVTPGLLILPAWSPAPSESKTRILRMDPGPAFGTGSHPTTRMCLQAMENSAPKRAFSLLDVGTGSGILAMYGVLLGASACFAMDVDEEALRWAEWNIHLNGLDGKVELSAAPISKLKKTFSMVTANLVLDVILDIMPCFPRLVGRGGTLILSGLLREQVPLVLPDLARSGFTVVGRLEKGEWACIVAGRSLHGRPQKGAG